MPKTRKFDPREFSDAPDTEITAPVTRSPKDKRSPWLGGTAGGTVGKETDPEPSHEVKRPGDKIQPPITRPPKSGWTGGTAGGRITESPSPSKGQSAGGIASHPENVRGKYGLTSTATNKKVTKLLKKDPDFRKDFDRTFGTSHQGQAGASAGSSAKKPKHSYKKTYK
jgi:hypothetical protein